MICPMCARTSLVYEPWGADVVAVCRSVRRCGLRVCIPAGAYLSVQRREAYVRKHWREELRPGAARAAGALPHRQKVRGGDAGHHEVPKGATAPILGRSRVNPEGGLGRA